MKKLMLNTAILSLMGCGYQGPVGAPGSNGDSCSVSSVSQPVAGSYIQCTNGTASFVTSGTVLTPIQFCPNVVPTYPTVFPEVGFLINGSIYAVYSANDGFLSVIPPGTYTSNAVGSACNFTVNADGTVSN